MCHSSWVCLLSFFFFSAFLSLYFFCALFACKVQYFQCRHEATTPSPPSPPLPITIHKRAGGATKSHIRAILHCVQLWARLHLLQFRGANRQSGHDVFLHELQKGRHGRSQVCEWWVPFSYNHLQTKHKDVYSYMYKLTCWSFFLSKTQAECKVMDRSRRKELDDRTLTFRIVEPTLSYARDGTIKDPLRMLFEYWEEG